ncbi:unnamed protein product [Ectocarpus sp. CCAP 1310/34]|nr:unnamed protein product [Ectocarpus sp. CCAP 1310/34]
MAVAGTRGMAACKVLMQARVQRQACAASSRARPLQPRRPSFRVEDVLYMDNHVLLVNKPAGLLSQSDRTGDADVAALAREYVRVAANKTGEAFVALVHRLDRPVSGVMCVARTSKAAARLSASFRARDGVEKIYHAVVAGGLAGRGIRQDFLVSPDASGAVARRGRGPRTGLSSAPVRGGAGGRLLAAGPTSSSEGKLAQLEWEAIDVSPSSADRLRCPRTGNPRTLVRVRLITGRKHQIRVQLAEMGHPVVGDTRYGRSSWCQSRGGDATDESAVPPPRAGSMEPLEDRSILLHASELIVPHPTRVGAMVRAVAAPPGMWSDLCGRSCIDEVFGDQPVTGSVVECARGEHLT